MARTRAAAKAHQTSNAATCAPATVRDGGNRVSKTMRSTKNSKATSKKTEAARKDSIPSTPTGGTVSVTSDVMPASTVGVSSVDPAIADTGVDSAAAAFIQAPSAISADAAVGEGPAILSKRTRDGRGREPREHRKRDYNSTITVVVGPDEHREGFTIHEDQICKVSPFFVAACSKEWLEGQTRTIRLPTYQVKYFRHYAEWVYCGRVILTELKDEYVARALAAGEITAEATPQALANLCQRRPHQYARAYCKVWLIADYLNDSACQEACMQKLLQMSATHITWLHPSNVELVSEKTSTASSLFKWTVETIAKALAGSGKSAQHLREYREALPETVKDALLKGQGTFNVGRGIQQDRGTSGVNANGISAGWWD